MELQLIVSLILVGFSLNFAVKVSIIDLNITSVVPSLI
jgi:hypothetical protein